jgi:hypothetical protein
VVDYSATFSFCRSCLASVLRPSARNFWRVFGVIPLFNELSRIIKITVTPKEQDKK